MLRIKKQKFTPQEYLAMEEVAQYKSEYFQGEIFALSGGSADHSTVQTNLIAGLHARLAAGPCRVFASDLRIHVRASNLYTYPDISVVCGKVQFLDRRTDTILNPLLIIEVLSPATREYDRGDKFELYKGVPSLQEYLLVDSERPHIESFRRRDHDWIVGAIDGLEAACRIESLETEVPMRDVYGKVTWLD